MDIKDAKQLIPGDFSRHCVRDISVFTCSVFGETYINTFKELWGIDFSAVLWVIRDRNRAAFYRSKKEHGSLDEYIGKKAMDKSFTIKLSEKLRELADWLNRFMKENNRLELFLAHKKEFVDAYRVFFAYHQAVYWGGDFICRNRPELKGIISELDDAYKYNEMITPKIEDYLVRMNLDFLRYDESKGEIKDRGLFFVRDRKTAEFSGKELDKLEDFIKSKEQKIENIMEFSGVGVYKGKAIGKVKLITDLNDLGSVKEGTILVTTMTRPQFNNCLKKCRGIVTDEGGMLCHASILARDAGIPCVVGTKIATKVLKDGDMVEIDGEKGLVKKTERRR